VLDSDSGRVLSDPDKPGFLRADLQCCTTVDLYDFAMPIRKQGGLFVMEEAGRR
jgi:hypothetical protein